MRNCDRFRSKTSSIAPIQKRDEMNRTILTLAGILFCTSYAFGQEFVVPQNTNSFQTNRASFQPPTTTGFQVETQKAEPPTPEIEGPTATIEPVPTQETNEPAVILPINEGPEPSVQLPAPKVEIKPVLREDTQVYKSTQHNNSMGVSDYRFEVAKEKARARRMRIEAKKWYGIDSSRPSVAPRGHLPTYSAYYNGVFSRPSYQYNRGAQFYFHVPVTR